MRELTYSKKGLSPLIATVLLIAFAVSLGTMIMSWSIEPEPTTTPIEEQGVCERTQITLQEITSGDAICYDQENEVVRFLLQNTGDTTISQLTLRVIDDQQGFNETTLNAELAPGDLGSWEIRHTTNSPETRTASIMPRVEDGNFAQSCPDQQIQEIQLPTC